MKKAIPYVLIFISALVIRLAAVSLTGRDTGELIHDATGYHEYAVHLVEKGVYQEDNGRRASRMPGYPMFMALVYSIGGQRVAAVQVAQAILGALTCVLLAFCAGRLVSQQWGMAAGAIAVIYFGLIAGTPRMLSEVLYIFLISSFFCLWFSDKNPSNQKTFALGAVLGAASLVRPEAAIIALLMGLLLLKKPWKVTWRPVFFLWMGVGCLLGPWMVRNYVVFHQFIPFTSRAGNGFYVRLQRFFIHFGQATPDSLKPLSSDELEDNRLFMEKAKELHRQTPWSTIIKFWFFGLATLFYPFIPEYDWTFVICIPFWIYGGLVLFRKGTRRDLALPVYVIGCVLIYTLLEATATRYRDPIAPAYILLATLGLSHIFNKPLTFPRKALVSGWVIFNLFVWHFAPVFRAMLLDCKRALW